MNSPDHTRLPEPLPEAAAISARLHALICEEIESHGGWIPFARFMELALYAPGLGYYSAGAAKLGSDPRDGSDFTTASELTPLFARALARPVARMLEDASASILELGGGSGKFAADLLLELEALDALPSHYDMLDVSADLRERQAATFAQRAPRLQNRVRWLTALPEAIDGVVIGNEVLDAMPVDCVVRAGDGWLERGIAIGDRGALIYRDRPAAAALEVAIRCAVPDAGALAIGYATEVHRTASAFVQTLVARMSDRSTMFLIDYGFPASEYFHSQRSSGTLMAHYRHRSTPDVLARVGLQDVTAHVDFSAVARAARDAGGAVIGYTGLASFLLDCGILQLIDAAPDDAKRWVPQAAALQKLLSEAEMGELFKVIVIARSDRPSIGFAISDRRAAL